ncbi:MAG: hypothetical protein AAGA55_02185 [Planctomycetota bacterium]
MLCLSLLALLLAGCNGSVRFSGRVIPGPVGVATVVAGDDARLSEPGVPGVDVALLQATSARGGSVVASTVTDENGAFEIILGRGQHPGGPVIVRVQGDSVFDARSRSYLPVAGQSLLCTVITREPRKNR